MSDDNTETPTDFIRQMVAADVTACKHNGRVARFPPEPNGYSKSVTRKRSVEFRYR